MHKADSTINWKTINYNVRLEKSKEGSKISQNKDGIINIAGGLLRGYWRETGSRNLSGRTHYTEYCVFTDSIYCATSGGNVWKADRNGNGWRVLNDGFKFDDIRMIKKIPLNSGYCLLLSSEGWGVPGFYYSDNDGPSWVASNGLNNITSWGYVMRTVVADDANKTIYLLALEWDYSSWNMKISLYVSLNKGNSFVPKISYQINGFDEANKYDIWCSPKGSVCYFLVGNIIYRIDDDFNMVQLGTINMGNPNGVRLSGCIFNGQTYLYAVAYSTNAVFYRSADGGYNWIQKGTLAEIPFMINSLEVSQKNPDVLYFGGVECYRSQNGGQNWTRINSWSDYYSDMINKLHADIPGINSFVDGEGEEIVYINTDGGTFISEDQLQTVKNISLENLNVSQYYSVYSHKQNNSIIFAGSQDQGYQLCSANSGTAPENFIQIISGDYGHIVSTNGGNSIWLVYPSFVGFYPNAVNNPYFIKMWDFTFTGQFWLPPLMAHPTNSNKVFVGGGSTGSGTHIFELTYNGFTINANELPYDFNGTTGATAISAMAYSPIDYNYRYVMNGNGEFFRSFDGGNTWTRTPGFDGPEGNYLYGACILPSKINLGTVYVAGLGYSNPAVFVSYNHGQSFTQLSAGLPQTMVYQLASSANDEFIFAATDAGPYVYIPQNDYWYDMAQNVAPDQAYWSVDFHEATNTARFGTYGRGIWDFQISESTFISTYQESSQLYVFPNPANKEINISGALDIILIYNSEGKIIFKTNSNKVDVYDFKPGIYIIKSGTKTGRFLKL